MIANLFDCSCQATAHRDHPHHIVGRHRRTSHHTRHMLKILALFMIAHYVMHFGWYVFTSMWLDHFGTDIADLGKAAGTSGTAPVIVAGLVGLAAWMHSLFE